MGQDNTSLRRGICSPLSVRGVTAHVTAHGTGVCSDRKTANIVMPIAGVTIYIGSPDRPWNRRSVNPVMAASNSN